MRKIIYLNIIFLIGAVVTEALGLSLRMYYYTPKWPAILGLPLFVILGWMLWDNLAWLMSLKISWFAGFIPLLIDFGLEATAKINGWWTWVYLPKFTLFGASFINYATYVTWGFLSIWLYRRFSAQKRGR